MTEIQRLNQSPVSQELKKELLNPSDKSLYLLQWIEDTIRAIQVDNLMDEVMTDEEAARLEALTFTPAEESKEVYKQILPISQEPWSNSEILKKLKEVRKQRAKLTDRDFFTTEAERELLQMFKENASENGADLTPSLHYPDR